MASQVNKKFIHDENSLNQKFIFCKWLYSRFMKSIQNAKKLKLKGPSRQIRSVSIKNVRISS